MLYFENDYSEGAHPLVLQRLAETNPAQQPGYGEDDYTRSACDKIREACRCPEAEIYLFEGGTQVNSTVISAYLRTTEGVIAAETGHIACHEAGAVEATGHKVLTLPQHEGRILPSELEALLRAFSADPARAHMVWPGMVYISQPTEFGTLYSLAELTALSGICRAYRLPLYMDGARLGYGLMSSRADAAMPDLARLCDCFTVGGTKVGALCGEAAVFPRGAPPRFFTHLKQHGALAAKGRLLGAQFEALFTDGLYFTISRRADEMAERMKRGFIARGYRLYLDSPTNQQFIVLENEEMERLAKRVRFSRWCPLDAAHTVARFAVSWATREEQVDRLMQVLDEEKERRKTE